MVCNTNYTIVVAIAMQGPFIQARAIITNKVNLNSPSNDYLWDVIFLWDDAVCRH